MIAYAFDDEEVEVVELVRGQKLPSRVKCELLNKKTIKYAFNANFERICLSKYLNTNLHPRSFRCTQALALQLGLPYSLDSVSNVLNLDTKKNKEGKNLIRYFTYHNKEENLVKWEKFEDYCKTDCIVEIDTQLIDRAIELNLYNEKLLSDKLKNTSQISNIKSPTQVKNYLKEKFNIEVDSLSKDKVEELIKTATDNTLIEVLNLRQSLTKTSIKKYQAMKRTMTKDYSIKGLFQYYGANKTGRWSGRLVQVQNLPQTKTSNLDLARNMIKNNDTKESYDIIKILYDNIGDTLSNLIRTAFIPRENKKFIISNFSAIEARVLTSLAKEEWRIKVFNTHGKIYEASAAKMFNVDIKEITKESELRQKGKIAELALEYQGSINALKVMGADKMGLDDAELMQLVKNYRSTNKNIVNFWNMVEEFSIKTIKNKRNYYFNQLEFIYDENYLFIKLPSGRHLSYYNPKLEIDTKYNREILTYQSINQTTKNSRGIQMINIAICKNRKDKLYENVEITYDKLYQILSNTKYTKESYKEYLKLPKDAQDNIKDVGGFVGGYLTDGKRTKATVKYRSLLTLDVDYGIKGLIDGLSMCQYFKSIIYTTHKHNKENERFRIVIPLSRKVDNIEYQALARQVANTIGIDYFDDSTYDPSRLMYFPSTSKDGVVGAFCKAYSIYEVIEHYLSDVYKPTENKDRYTYIKGSTSGGLIVYENGLFAYSHHSTDPCSKKLCNAFDLLKNHKFNNV